MHLFCDARRRNFNLLERIENKLVQAHSKRGLTSALHKNLRKEGVKNEFFDVGASEANLLYQ